MWFSPALGFHVKQRCIVYVCDCSFVHYLFTLQLLDNNATWIIMLLLVIQQLVSEPVPSGNSLTTGRRSWIILRMEYQCLMVIMVLSMRFGAEGWKYFYRNRDIIFGY